MVRGSESTQADVRGYHKERFNAGQHKRRGEVGWRWVGGGVMGSGEGGHRSIRATEQTLELNHDPEDPGMSVEASI